MGFRGAKGPLQEAGQDDIALLLVLIAKLLAVGALLALGPGEHVKGADRDEEGDGGAAADDDDADPGEDLVWLSESFSYAVGDDRKKHICLEPACLDSKGTQHILVCANARTVLTTTTGRSARYLALRFHLYHCPRGPSRFGRRCTHWKLKVMSYTPYIACTDSEWP